MATARTPRENWVEAGLTALAAGGPNAVRVEALADALGVTKGGFYGYFSNREALLLAMLDAWERESVDDVVGDIDQTVADPREKIRLAGRRTFSEDRLRPVDLAVRDWARYDPEVARRLRRVDNRRMDLLRELFAAVYSDPDEVEARSLLAFCLAIGKNFLAAEHGDRDPDAVVFRAANIVLGFEPGEPAG